MNRKEVKEKIVGITKKQYEGINNNFNKIVVGIISWGSLWFCNIIAFAFMGEFYSTKNINVIGSIFEIFISIFLVVFLLILMTSILIKPSGAILTLSAALLNTILTLAPYKPKTDGLSFYQKFVIWAFFFSNIILSVWIAAHLHPMKDLFVTKETKKTYDNCDVKIEETTKSYPIALPIIVAIIGATGGIISGVIK